MNDIRALLTDRGAVILKLFFYIALLAKRTLRVLYKPGIHKLDATRIAAKTFRMPVTIDGFYHATTYELLAFAAYWREQQLEVVFAKFSVLKLVVDAILKALKTLSTSLYKIINIYSAFVLPNEKCS